MSDESPPQLHDLQQPSTVTPTLPQQQQQQSQQDSRQNVGESSRRRSSSDPTGRGRQRPGLAIIRPRRGTDGAAMPPIRENVKTASTALFHGPNRRTEIDENVADILDVIGECTIKLF